MSGVTSQDAIDIARDDLLKRLVDDLTRKKLEAVDGDKWPEDLGTPSIYWAAPGDFPKGHWVVYLPPDKGALQSSVIILINKETGEVVYHGSANDEG